MDDYEARQERRQLDKSDAVFGDEVADYERSLLDVDDIGDMLFGLEPELWTAIDRRDQGLIGAIVLAARDAWASRVHVRRQGGNPDGMMSEKQAVNIAIVRYYADEAKK